MDYLQQQPHRFAGREAGGEYEWRHWFAMKLDCDAYGREILEYPTVLAGLSDNRIIKIDREEDGRFRVTEGCDDYFSARLTPEQLATLGRELIEMANNNMTGGEPAGKKP